MYLQCYTNALRELAKKYNKETVELTMVEQPELIGGFVLKVGDIEEDNSIRGKLTPHILTYLLYEHGEHGNATKRISTLWGIKIS